MVKSRSIHKIKEYEGLPKLTDFKSVETEIDEKLENGGQLIFSCLALYYLLMTWKNIFSEILTEALCFSVDPYVRWVKNFGRCGWC